MPSSDEDYTLGSAASAIKWASGSLEAWSILNLALWRLMVDTGDRIISTNAAISTFSQCYIQKLSHPK